MAAKSLKRRVPAARTSKHDQANPAKPADVEQATSETERRSKNFIQPAVLAKIREADGVPISMTELTVHLGVPKASVQHAVNQLMKTVPQIEIVTRGQVWRWNHLGHIGRPDNAPVAEDFGPVPEPPKQEETVKVWTSVGRAANGDQVARDAENKLYRIVPL